MKKRGNSFVAPASVYRRVAAFIIDVLILEFIVLIPFNSLIDKAVPGDNIIEQLQFLQQNPDASGFMQIFSLIISIFVVFYFSYFEYKLNQTPGKMFMRIYAVSETKTFGSYLLSNLTFIAMFPFILLWIIDPIYMFTSPKNQRLMEKWAHVVVVQQYPYR